MGPSYLAIARRDRQPAHTAWPLGRAKARFSEVVRLARTGHPQRVTVHGRNAVVIVASADFEQLAAREAAPTLHGLLSGSPLSRVPDAAPRRAARGSATATNSVNGWLADAALLSRAAEAVPRCRRRGVVGCPAARVLLPQHGHHRGDPASPSSVRHTAANRSRDLARRYAQALVRGADPAAGRRHRAGKAPHLGRPTGGRRRAGPGRPPSRGHGARARSDGVHPRRQRLPGLRRERHRPLGACAEGRLTGGLARGGDSAVQSGHRAALLRISAIASATSTCPGRSSSSRWSPAMGPGRGRHRPQQRGDGADTVRVQPARGGGLRGLGRPVTLDSVRKKVSANSPEYIP